MIVAREYVRHAHPDKLLYDCEKTVDIGHERSVCLSRILRNTLTKKYFPLFALYRNVYKMVEGWKIFIKERVVNSKILYVVHGRSTGVEALKYVGACNTRSTH